MENPILMIVSQDSWASLGTTGSPEERILHNYFSFTWCNGRSQLETFHKLFHLPIILVLWKLENHILCCNSLCVYVICAVLYVLWAYAHSEEDAECLLPHTTLPAASRGISHWIRSSPFCQPSCPGSSQNPSWIQNPVLESQAWPIMPGFLFTLSAGDASSGPHAYIASASTCWDAFSVPCYNSYLKILKPHPLLWKKEKRLMNYAWS